MMFETPRYRLCEKRELQIAEFGFVVFMSLELGLKILADGLFFTPKALFKDAAGILDLFTFAVSCTFSQSNIENEILNITLEMFESGWIGNADLDACSSTTEFWCSAIVLVTLFATTSYLHLGTAYEKSRL